jgi:hypothetical protein
MARKTYTSEVEAYIDAELAAARQAAQTESGRTAVSEGVSLTILATLRAALVRGIRLYGATTLIALLPALVIVARGGLSALPQLGDPAAGWLSWAGRGLPLAAAGWALLVMLWQARNAWRRARGQAPATLRFRRARNTSERDQYQELPPLEQLAIKLGVAVATLPALLWLALSNSGDPLWLLGALVALPPFFLLITVRLTSLLSGLGAVGAVDSSHRLDRPSQQSRGVTVLDERITQLQQMRDWLKDDKLRAMMDDVIGKQVAKSERRQVTYSVAVGALSLLAGWLLSAVSPVSALAQLLPR